MAWFLYDNGLRHERVNYCCKALHLKFFRGFACVKLLWLFRDGTLTNLTVTVASLRYRPRFLILRRLQTLAEAYLEPSRTSAMMLFCENS